MKPLFKNSRSVIFPDLGQITAACVFFKCLFVSTPPVEAKIFENQEKIEQEALIIYKKDPKKAQEYFYGEKKQKKKNQQKIKQSKKIKKFICLPRQAVALYPV